MMYGLGGGRDDFIHAAIFTRTGGLMKYSWPSEEIYTSLTEGYEDGDDESKGADEATQMWKYYANYGSRAWGSAYLNLYKYRSWGYGIWDNPLTKCMNATSLNSGGLIGTGECDCHFCSWRGWEEKLKHMEE